MAPPNFSWRVLRMKRFIAFFIVCLTCIVSSSGFADDKKDASKFVDNLGRQALAVITDKAKTKEAKNASLEKLFVDNVDIEWMGKFVVGRNWKSATDEQKKLYLTNYKTFLVSHYTSNFAEFTDADFEVTRVIPDGNAGNIVTMRIKRPQSEDVIAEYTVRKGDKGSLMVYDITVEGVSLITTQRSDFSSVISQHGFDYLISQLAVRSKKPQ